MYIISLWIDVLSGRKSNWEFFTILNSGWLNMEFHSRYGDSPTEEQQWQWMFENAETIRLPSEDFDTLMVRLGLVDDV